MDGMSLEQLWGSARRTAAKFVGPIVFKPCSKAWLAQANRIFPELQEVAHVEDYVCIDEVRFALRIANKRHINTEGYLFVCPPQDFRTGTEAHADLYRWPDCPAYWSLDPSGVVRLSTEDAGIIGLPAIHIETTLRGSSWDRSVYKGLRRFQEGKGLDSESREVARWPEYALYEVLRDVDSGVPFPAREVNDWPCRWWCKQDDPALCQSLGHYL
ncbi:hypothetical protein MSAN_02280000 [Mycena sanguinolenta]|uniref:Uncharacterized protein n=1 Tax=Mycena sanguinolenta TaxID=230812 RepID=A0A8H6X9R4_9AGAR|nr:hypothetical protein MSAN_02280000 [Mycena sanguinolenta]